MIMWLELTSPEDGDWDIVVSVSEEEFQSIYKEGLYCGNKVRTINTLNQDNKLSTIRLE